MTAHSIHLHASHSLGANWVFWFKSRLLMARRLLRDIGDGDSFGGYHRSPLAPDMVPLAHDEHRLYCATDPRERELELGKVQNLRVACAALNGIVLERGEVFSFWRQVGRTSRRKGYVEGRELRQGCMIPNVGGGICQLSNALSQIAHRSGMEIVERHSHTVHPAGFFIDDATDATVFWNYVDFRFRAKMRLRIGAELTETTLLVRLDSVP